MPQYIDRTGEKYGRALKAGAVRRSEARIGLESASHEVTAVQLGEPDE